MKTEPNKPIFELNEKVRDCGDGSFIAAKIFSAGLTKRELFAAMAMQRFPVTDYMMHEAANAAVEQADALIEALNKYKEEVVK